MRTLESTSLEGRERTAIEEAVAVLKERFELEGAVLFGSKARGDDDKYSDVDLLLITSRHSIGRKKRPWLSFYLRWA
jgi:predicted nucleotidyltransferase